MQRKQSALFWVKPLLAAFAVTVLMSAADVETVKSQRKLGRQATEFLESVQKAREGDLDRLRRSLARMSPWMRGEAVRSLRDMAGPVVRELLLDVACGRIEGEWADRESAALAFRRKINDPREARRLLEAKDPHVVCIGLGALFKEKVPIDRELMEDLRRVLQSKDWHVRRFCANWVRSAAGAADGREVARMVIASLKTVPQIDSADQLIGDLHFDMGIFTRAGWLYRDLTRALSGSSLFGLRDLVALTPEKPGVARDCVWVARALRGDSMGRQELYRIMRSCPEPAIRSTAVYWFYGNGEPADLPVLREVAEKDPYSVELSERDRRYLEWKYKAYGLAEKLPVGDRYWSVREYAKFVIRSIEWATRQRSSGQTSPKPQGSGLTSFWPLRLFARGLRLGRNLAALRLPTLGLPRGLGGYGGLNRLLTSAATGRVAADVRRRG